MFSLYLLWKSCPFVQGFLPAVVTWAAPAYQPSLEKRALLLATAYAGVGARGNQRDGNRQPLGCSACGHRLTLPAGRKILALASSVFESFRNCFMGSLFV